MTATLTIDIPQPLRFIVDLHERRVVSTAKTLRGAVNAAERRNMKYGAHRYAQFPADLLPVDIQAPESK